MPTVEDQHHAAAVAANASAKRIRELEGDLQVAQMQLQRIDEVLVGSYGDIPRLSPKDARRMLQNIAYIVKPF